MKSITKIAAAALIGAASVALSACATGLPTQVTRYSAMPIPAGQSFFVVDANNRPLGLEFGRYAAIVGQQMQARGFRQAASPQTADMLVRMDFDIDQGHVEYARDPFVPTYSGIGRYGVYGHPWGYYGSPYYSRYGYYGPRSPFYYGWHNPFYGLGANGYLVYRSQLELEIVRRADNAPLFEGRAQARSHTDNRGILVPNLIEAMFTGFPGRSGETVRITVPAAPRR
ncbi:MAG TPA: DUF4136 domain-containing protein [Sphingomicrobium sp.]|nr:DUF4136 domain-containing protein [Sphingomicrobium sp.]